LIVAGRQSVVLNAATMTVDAATFEALVKEDGGEPGERALMLYHGDLLDGLTVRSAGFEDWLLVERQRLRQLAIDALTRQLAASPAGGGRHRIAAAARRLLSFDPLHEPACRALMQAHA